MSLFRPTLVTPPVVLSRPGQAADCVADLHLREPALKVVFNLSFSLPPILCVFLSLPHIQSRVHAPAAADTLSC